MFSLIVMSGVKIPQEYQMFAALFAKSGTLANPILYIFFNKDVSFTFSSNYIPEFFFNPFIIGLDFMHGL